MSIVARAWGLTGVLTLLAGLGGPASAGSDAADTCRAAKLKVVGKHYFCIEKAEAKALKTGAAADYGTCVSSFDDKWDAAENRAAGQCPDNAPTAGMRAYVAAQAIEAMAIVAGTAGLPGCGDDLVNLVGEQCDGADLGGETCASLGFAGGALACAGCTFDTAACVPRFPSTGQSTSYGTGSDGNLQHGAPRSFTDNGDGTITDHVTGLMWEKKEDRDGISATCTTEYSAASCPNPHDADNTYAWCADADDSGTCDNPNNPLDGSVATLFLTQLNFRCNLDPGTSCASDADCSAPDTCGFAGYQDWRLPNLFELHSLANLELAYPAAATYPAFDQGCAAACDLRDANTCSCTTPLYYWSSTTDRFTDGNAWSAGFRTGATSVMSKFDETFVFARAIRGGS